MIGAQSSRGFQDVVEEVSDGDDDSDGSDGGTPPLGSAKVIVGGWPTFGLFITSFRHGPVLFLFLGAVGGASGSSMSESRADASKAEISIASSCKSK